MLKELYDDGTGTITVVYECNKCGKNIYATNLGGRLFCKNCFEYKDNIKW